MNYNVSKYLKQCRETKKLTQKNVFAVTGITDSRLSRIENGKANINILSVSELRSLIKLYDIPAVDLFIKSEYINHEDLKEYQYVFKGVSLLDNEELNHIQEEIDFINERRGK